MHLYEKAIEMFDKAILLDNKYVTAYYNKGLLNSYI